MELRELTCVCQPADFFDVYGYQYAGPSYGRGPFRHSGESRARRRNLAQYRGTLTSFSLQLTASDPLLSPRAALSRAAPASITITGTEFDHNQRLVQWNGVNLATVYGFFFNGTTEIVELVRDCPTIRHITASEDSKRYRQHSQREPVRFERIDRDDRQSSGTYSYQHLSSRGGPINQASAETLTGTGFTDNEQRRSPSTA